MDTQEKPLVLIVDDDLFMMDFIHEALSQQYRVITAESGKEGLLIAQQQHPQLILTDVLMPEMDGYELCRLIKEDFDISDTPVLFLSALDGIEDRLQGFEAGGEDFVIKPVNPKVLLAKVAQVFKLIEERQQLKSQAQYATTTALLAMTSMSETGLIFEGFKRFNQVTSQLELAQATQSALALFEVESVVELLLPAGQSIAVNKNGPATELEISVLKHMAGMDRITHFKSRMAITYPHVRVLISNMPVEDTDRCGRLRDHLAMLVEAAEVRLESINVATQMAKRNVVIGETIKTLSKTLVNIDTMQRNGRANAALILNDVKFRIEGALAGLGLSEKQENTIIGITQDGLESISNTLLAEAHFQDQLSVAIQQLQSAIETD